MLPVDLTSGSYQFNDLTDRAIGILFEGKVIYDKTFGHVSYGCASCCGSLGTPWFSPSPLGVGVSYTNQADVLDNDGCDGYQSSVLYGFSSWSSANTSVATINSASALVTGMGTGSAVQSLPGSITIGGLDFKKCRVAQYTPGGPANVGVKLLLVSNDCSSTSKTGTMHAGWGVNGGLSGCLLSANVPYNAPLTQGGACVSNPGVFEVYQYESAGKDNYAYPVSSNSR